MTKTTCYAHSLCAPYSFNVLCMRLIHRMYQKENHLKLIHSDRASVVRTKLVGAKRRTKWHQMKWRKKNDFLFNAIKMGLPTRVKVTLEDYRIKYVWQAQSRIKIIEKLTREKQKNFHSERVTCGRFLHTFCAHAPIYQLSNYKCNAWTVTVN